MLHSANHASIEGRVAGEDWYLAQMHRTQKAIVAKLRSLLCFMRISPPRNKVNVYHISNPYTATQDHHVQTCPKEVYLPGHLWDALNPTERFASVADLCAHVGDQLPIQVVKLIARDVLRALEDFHSTRGIAHSDISPNNILLSPTDLKSLISQLRAETQTSLRPSELSVGNLFDGDGFVFPDAVSVFRLSSTDNREIHRRPDYIGSQALRSPEALLGAHCGTNTDMWALGCVLFELLTGDALFDPVFQTSELHITNEESHLIQMVELFGEMPSDLVRIGKYSSQWFTAQGDMRINTTYYPISLESVLERHIEKSDVVGTAAFLNMLLNLRPDSRARPRDIIDHGWFSES